MALQDYLNNSMCTVPSLTANSARVRISGIQSEFWNAYDLYGSHTLSFIFSFGLIGRISVQLNNDTAIVYQGERCFEFTISDLSENSDYTFTSTYSTIPSGWGEYSGESIRFNIDPGPPTTALYFIFHTPDQISIKNQTFYNEFDVQTTTSLSNATGIITNKFVQYTLYPQGSTTPITSSARLSPGTSWRYLGLQPNTQYLLTTDVYETAISELTIASINESFTTKAFSPTITYTDITQQAFGVLIENIPYVGTYNLSIVCNDTTYTAIIPYDDSQWIFGKTDSYIYNRIGNILQANHTYSSTITLTPSFISGVSSTTTSSLTTIKDTQTIANISADWFDVNFDINVAEPSENKQYIDDLTYVAIFNDGSTTFSSTFTKPSGVVSVSVNANSQLIPYTRYEISVKVYDSQHVSGEPVKTINIGEYRTAEVLAEPSLTFDGYNGTFSLALITTVPFEYNYAVDDGPYSEYQSINTPSTFIVPYLNKQYTISYNIRYNNIVVSATHTYSASTQELESTFVKLDDTYHKLHFGLSEMLNGVYWVKYTISKGSTVLITTDYIQMQVNSTGTYGAYEYSNNILSNTDYTINATIYQFTNEYFVVGSNEMTIHTKGIDGQLELDEISYIYADLILTCNAAESLELSYEYNIYHNGAPIWDNNRTIALTTVSTLISIDELLTNTSYTISGKITENITASEEKVVELSFKTEALDYTYTLAGGENIIGKFEVEDVINYYYTTTVRSHDYVGDETRQSASSFTIAPVYYNSIYTVVVKLYINNRLSFYTSKTATINAIQITTNTLAREQHRIQYNIDLNHSGEYYYQTWRSTTPNNLLYDNTINYTGESVATATDIGLIGAQAYTYVSKLYQKLQSKSSYLPLDTNSILVGEKSTNISTPGIPVSSVITGRHQTVLNFTLTIGEENYTDDYIINWYICQGARTNITLADLPAIRTSAIVKEEGIARSGSVITYSCNSNIGQALTPDTDYYLAAYITNAENTSSGLTSYNSHTLSVCTLTTTAYSRYFKLQIGNLNSDIQYKFVYTIGDVSDNTIIYQNTSYQWNTKNELLPSTTYTLKLYIYDLGLSDNVAEQIIERTVTTARPSINYNLSDHAPFSLTFTYVNNDALNYTVNTKLTNSGTTHIYTINLEAGATNYSICDGLIPNTQYQVVSEYLYNGTVLYTTPIVNVTTDTFNISKTNQKLDCFAYTADFSANDISLSNATFVFILKQNSAVIDTQTITQTGTTPVSYFTNKLEPSTAYVLNVNYRLGVINYEQDFSFTSSTFNGYLSSVETTQQSFLIKWNNFSTSVNYSIKFTDGYNETAAIIIDNTTLNKFSVVSASDTYRIPIDETRRFITDSQHTIACKITPIDHNSITKSISLTTQYANKNRYTVTCDASYSSAAGLIVFNLTSPYAYDYLQYTITIKHNATTVLTHDIVKPIGETEVQWVSTDEFDPFLRYNYEVQVYDYDAPTIELFDTPITGIFDGPHPQVGFSCSGNGSTKRVRVRFTPDTPVLGSDYRYIVTITDNYGGSWPSALYEVGTYGEITNVVSQYQLYYEIDIYKANSPTVVFHRARQKLSSGGSVSGDYLAASPTYTSLNVYVHNLAAETYSVYYDLYLYGSSNKIASSPILTGVTLDTKTRICPYLFENLTPGTRYTLKAYITNSTATYTDQASQYTKIISGCLLDNIQPKLKSVVFDIVNMPTDIYKQVDIWVDDIQDEPLLVDISKSTYTCHTTMQLYANSEYTIKVRVSEVGNALNYQEFVPFTVTTLENGTVEILSVNPHGCIFKIKDYEGDIIDTASYEVKYEDTVKASGSFNFYDSAITVTDENILSLVRYKLIVYGYDADGYIIYQASANFTTTSDITFDLAINDINFTSITIQYKNITPSAAITYAAVYVNGRLYAYKKIPANATQSDPIQITDLLRDTTYTIDARLMNASLNTLLARQSEKVHTLTWGTLNILGAGNNYIACQATNLLLRRPLELRFYYSTDNSTFILAHTQSMNADFAPNTSVININGLNAGTYYYIKMEIYNGWTQELLHSEVKGSTTTATDSRIIIHSLTKTSITVSLTDAYYDDGTAVQWTLKSGTITLAGQSDTIISHATKQYTPSNYFGYSQTSTYTITAAIKDSNGNILETATLIFKMPSDKLGQLQRSGGVGQFLQVYVDNLEDNQTYSIIYYLQSVTYQQDGTPIYGPKSSSPAQKHIGAISIPYTFTNVAYNSYYLVSAYITDANNQTHEINKVFYVMSEAGEIKFNFLSSGKADFWLDSTAMIANQATITWTLKRANTIVETGTSYVYPFQGSSTYFTTTNTLLYSTPYEIVASYTYTGLQTPITLSKQILTPAVNECFDVEFTVQTSSNASYKSMQELDVTISGFDITKTYRVVRTYYNNYGQIEFNSEEYVENKTFDTTHINRFESGKQYTLQVDIYQLTPTTASYSITKACPVINEPFLLVAGSGVNSVDIAILGIDIGYRTYNEFAVYNSTTLVNTTKFNLEVQNYEDPNATYYHTFNVSGLQPNTQYSGVLSVSNEQGVLQFKRYVSFKTSQSDYRIAYTTASTKNSITINTSQITLSPTIRYYLYDYAGYRKTSLINSVTHTSCGTTDTATFSNLSVKHQYLLTIVVSPPALEPLTYTEIVSTLSAEGTYPLSERWSWNHANGPEKNATDSQTIMARMVLDNNVSTEYPESVRNFSFMVWDDFVAKINDIRNHIGLEWNNTYGSVDETRMYHAGVGAADRQLTARRMMALYTNIDYQERAGEETELTKAVARGDISYGKQVKSQYFYDLVTLINDWIVSIQ